MLNFILQNPTKIIFGKNTVSKLSSEIPKDAKILMIYGGGSIKTNGVYDDVKRALKGFDILEFSGIEPNPDFETCIKARDFARANDRDFLLAVGGGSVLDATKFIAQIFYENDGKEIELLKIKRLAKNALPLASVMTLPATGSEMNSGGVISIRKSDEKLSFHNPLTFPKFSIIDPSYTKSLPLRQIQNGIVDSFVHTLEQYTTYDVNSPLQDYFAIGILRTLITEGKKAINGYEYETMSNICWASTCALNGWISVGVVQDWAVHLIGHELTAFYGIDHAQSLAIVLSGRYKFAFESKKEKLYKIGVEVFGLKGSLDEIALRTIDEIEKFFRFLGIKTRLSDYDISYADASSKISDRFKLRNIKFGERGEITADSVKDILSMVK